VGSLVGSSVGVGITIGPAHDATKPATRIDIAIALATRNALIRLIL